ncbi:MAG: ABC transporter substrate-binding protein [Coriobacteriales bacterium]|jgi:NitT/TauT family transport system substrate-binding protein|nr:ABC transporter substrate-binding protein [Coriobacteriales bacterium]
MTKKGTTLRTQAGCLLLALMMALSLALVGCGGGASDSPAAADSGTEAGSTSTVTLKLQGLGGSPNTTDAPTIGREKGFFAAEGLELENVGNIQVPQWVPSLENGDIDACLIMTSEGLAAIDNGADIIAVAGGSDTYSSDNTHMTFLALKDNSDIGTFAERGAEVGKDFVGKRFASPNALGGCTVGFPLELMRQAGVEDPLNQFASNVTVPEAELVETLLRGDVDIVGTHLVPRVVREQYGDEVKIVFSDYDILGELGGDMEWYMRRDFVDANPDIVRSFVAAIANTNNFIDDNPEEAGEIYKEATINIYQGSINDDFFNVRHYAKDGLIREAHTQLWIDLLGNPGQVQQFKTKLTFDQVATNEFNAKA